MLVQEEMIGRVRRLCCEDERVRAALMYGSFSKGSGDAYSDIEFFIFLEDDRYETVDAENWVAQVAPLAFYFVNEFGVGTAVFQNLVRGEFHFEKASTMDQVRGWKELAGFPAAGAMLILDRTGELAGYLQEISGPGPDRATRENVVWLWQSYVNWMLFGANVFARGERARALEILWFVQRHLLWLARLLQGQTERWQTPAKEVEQDLSPAAYQQYVACTGSLKEGSLERAYLTAWEWGKEMGAILGGSYDLDMASELLPRLDTRFRAAFSPDLVLIFETERLMIRAAGVEDVELYYRLWTDPLVMTNVGFPKGLRITRQEVREKLLAQEGQVFDSRLVVTLKHNGEAIGECKLGRPDEQGLSETDIKLLPVYWGNKYGVEVKQGLVDYLFQHTGCQAVQATPNVKNVASIKMQEAVGGVRLGEAVYEFPAEMAGYTTPVHHYIYQVRREDWERRREANQAGKSRPGSE